MKKSDIKVGDRLAYSRSNDYQKYGDANEVEVLRLDVTRKGSSFLDASYVGTEVRHIKTGRTEVVRNNRLKEPWATYTERQRKIKADRLRAANEKAAARTNRLLAAADANAVLVGAGFPTRKEQVLTHDLEDDFGDYIAQGFVFTQEREDSPWYTVETVFVNLREHVEYGKRLVLDAHAVADSLVSA